MKSFLIAILVLWASVAGAQITAESNMKGTYMKREQIIDILERAREFVQDNEEDLLRVGTMDLVYRPYTRQRSADNDAQAAIDKAERLKRETQLRRDIEEMIRRMK